MERFNLFTEDELKELENNSTIVNYTKNTVIINQWEYGNDFYYIVEGEISVYVINKQGEEITIDILKKGGYFGELALLVDSIRSASVRANTEVKLLKLNKEQFDSFLNSHADFESRLLKVLSTRLARILNVLSEKSQKKFIELKYNDAALERLNHFESYFTKISPFKVIKTNIEEFKSRMSKYTENEESYYFLIRNHLKNGITLPEADHIVNFVENDDSNFYLPSGCSSWTIENAVRKITKKTIGLALASGGAPGMAHIGVLNTFKKQNIPIDFIAGASAGALYGAVFSFGHSFHQLLDLMRKEVNKSAFLIILTNFCFNFSGILKNTHLRKMLKPLFLSTNLEDSIIPFAAVCSDLYSGKTIVIKEGDTINALLASNSAPLIVEPVKYLNYLLIDGVATAPLPVKALYDENIDIKVAVNISQLDLVVSMNESPKLLKVYLRSRSMMANEMANSEANTADVIIVPKIDNGRLFDWKSMDQYIQSGADATESAIKKIEQYLKSPWYS